MSNGNANKGKGRSLHIGLNLVDPDSYEGWDGALQGCEHDADDMLAIANASGFESKKILTKDATADTVKQAIAEAAGALVSGDTFFLTYSGHGSQVPDSNGDEREDGVDETWVLYDRQLVDDELYELWGSFAPGVRIVVLSDSCHSGSAIREVLDAVNPDALEARVEIPKPNGMRAMPKAQAEEVYKAHRELYDEIQKNTPAQDTVEVGAHVLLISGCQDNQTSADGKRNGLFTQTLLGVWDGGTFKGGYKRFYSAIVEQMPPWQSPNWLTVGAPSTTLPRRRPFSI
jgi:metacaspase-1